MALMGMALLHLIINYSKGVSRPIMLQKIIEHGLITPWHTSNTYKDLATKITYIVKSTNKIRYRHQLYKM